MLCPPGSSESCRLRAVSDPVAIPPPQNGRPSRPHPHRQFRPQPNIELNKVRRRSNRKIDDSFIHPLMRLLLGAGYEKFPSASPYQRLFLRALAAPVSLLWDSFPSLTRKESQQLIDNFRASANFLLTLSEERDEALEFVKFHVSSWFQRGNGDLFTTDLPTAESPHMPVPNTLPSHLKDRLLFSGFLWKMIKRTIARARQHNTRALSILTSFHLVKLGWGELHFLKFIKTVQSHQKLYSAPPPPLSVETIDHLRSATESVLGDPRHPPSLSKCLPSRSACVENARSKGGAFGLVVEGNSMLPPLSELLESSKKLGMLRALSDVSFQLKDRSFAWALEAQTKRLSLTGSNRLSTAKMQVIPEPGKFRVITAGSAEIGILSQPLQGALLDLWSQTPYSTMKSTWIEDLSLFLVTVPNHFVFFSGDYDAATDRLNLRSSVICLERCLDHFQIRADFAMGVNKMRIEYPFKELREMMEGLTDKAILADCEAILATIQPSIVQNNGQLMGHPLSFPLLCIINLAGFDKAITDARSARIISADEAVIIRNSLRINGDDIFFASPPAFVPIFERCSSEVGFTLTIGKSYVSPYFLMINNVFFVRHGNRVERFGYLNQRLLFNVNIKKGDAPETPVQIGRAFSEMFELCPGSFRFLPDAVSKRQSGFAIKGFRPNFFIPCGLGGLGVDPKFATSDPSSSVPDGKYGMTRQQRLVAALCYEDQLSSALMSSGKNPQDPILRQLLTRLGRPVPVHSSQGLMRSEERTDPSVEDLPLPFQILSGLYSVPVSRLEENVKNFQYWLSQVQLYVSEKSSFDRRISFDNLGKLKPMSRSKLLALTHLGPEQFQPTFPLLPPPAQRFCAVYPSFSSSLRDFTIEQLAPVRVFVPTVPHSWDSAFTGDIFHDLHRGTVRFNLPDPLENWEDELSPAYPLHSMLEEPFFRSERIPIKYRIRRLLSQSQHSTSFKQKRPFFSHIALDLDKE
jgi:hypothetical protein